MTYLLLALCEKAVGIHPIRDGIADDGHIIADKRRLIGILHKDLFEYGPYNRQPNTRSGSGEDSEGIMRHDRTGENYRRVSLEHLSTGITQDTGSSGSDNVERSR